MFHFYLWRGNVSFPLLSGGGLSQAQFIIAFYKHFKYHLQLQMGILEFECLIITWSYFLSCVIMLRKFCECMKCPLQLSDCPAKIFFAPIVHFKRPTALSEAHQQTPSSSL